MPATTASATLRRTLRCSAIGLGLLVSVGVLAPPAHAALTSAIDLPVVADYSVAGTVHIQLAAAPAPDDLDLSGARFDVLGIGDAVLGSCDTGVTGACDIPMADYAGTSTTYRLVQEAGHPVPGLVPSTLVSTFTVRTSTSCSPDATDCPNPTITVTDGSRFRTGVSVTVRDAGTDAPLSGAEYSLSGPGYPRVPATPEDAETTAFPDPTLSGPDGRLTFAGLFLPGDWSLTPEVTPPGYRSSGVVPVTVPAPTADAGDAWSTVVGLAADVPDVLGVGRPVVPTAASPAPPAGSAPRPVVATPAVASPVAVSPGPALVTASPPVPADSSAEPSASDRTLSPPAAESASMADPQLRVRSATSWLDVGLVGFAAVLVALVVFGVGYVRRRAQH
jgi:hypothetical protein